MQSLLSSFFLAFSVSMCQFLYIWHISKKRRVFQIELLLLWADANFYKQYNVENRIEIGPQIMCNARPRVKQKLSKQLTEIICCYCCAYADNQKYHLHVFYKIRKRLLTIIFSSISRINSRIKMQKKYFTPLTRFACSAASAASG